MFNNKVLSLFALPLLMSGQAFADDAPIKVKVFIGSMFEIGKNTGDKAGEFQHWYERYFKNSQPITVKGAASPVFCNDDGVCGSVLGMGKVASSSSVQAICLIQSLICLKPIS
ncbi:Purine nucleoside permease [Budvicia aquatica]|uniref:Purine nucleoside permease n=1 Tax=Budvicia aquatica TaxID=82979 RepID=A0A484ZF57_9GAMM|nr:purine nucleoside permease [Budvicia aquatica]VFS46728.1 Purine nucleoside permease [Budvicia aquatica]